MSIHNYTWRVGKQVCMNEVVAHTPPEYVPGFSSCAASASCLISKSFVTSAWQLIHLRHPEKQV
jgi:hypothetical protein